MVDTDARFFVAFKPFRSLDTTVHQSLGNQLGRSYTQKTMSGVTTTRPFMKLSLIRLEKKHTFSTFVTVFMAKRLVPGRSIMATMMPERLVQNIKKASMKRVQIAIV